MENRESLDQRGSARRKLIRGSFAAPVILTLHSGASVAAASVNSCLKRPPGGGWWDNGPPEVTNRPDDMWLRYQLWGYSKNGQIDEKCGLWIRGSDFSAQRMGGSTSLSSNAYRRFDTGGSSTGYGNVQLSQPKGPDAPGYRWAPVEKYVSLRVDKHGHIVGFGKHGDGFNVTGSCWSSFKAGGLG